MMLAAAVEYAKQLIAIYKMGIFDACRFAAWEYEVDSDKIYRAITE